MSIYLRIVILVSVFAYANGHGRVSRTLNKGHGNEIDNPTVPQESVLEDILESEAVFINNVARKAKGIHPYGKRWQLQEKNDEHTFSNFHNDVQIHIDKKPGRIQERNFGAYIIFGTGGLWPGGVIPYVVDTASYKDINLFNNLLKASIGIIAEETCIRWVPWTESLAKTLGHNNYVTFVSGNGICKANIGVSSGKIFLSEPGCMLIRTFLHEMYHTIGMQHEQSRSDRGQYLKINWENVKLDKAFAFIEKETRTHDTLDPYSLVMYYFHNFSKNGKRTIQLKNKNYEFLTTESRNTSFYDIADINNMYRCAENCVNPPACGKMGFLNHRCECRCPEGLRGRTCSVTDGNCGGFLDLASGETKVITSPDWPNKYALDLNCVWVILSPANHRIKVTITDLDLAWNKEHDRCYHWLELCTNLIGEPGIKRCGNLSDTSIVEYFHSVNDEAHILMIKFDSVFADDRSATGGFKLQVHAFRSGCISWPCKMGGTCLEGDSDFTYSCVCPPGYSGKDCDQVKENATVICNMETDFGINCWLVRNPEYRWKQVAKKSKLQANEGVMFAITIDKTSILETGVHFEVGERCLTFDYYNDGGLNGGLSVYYQGDFPTEKQQLFSTYASEGDQWKTVRFLIPAIRGLKITFEGKNTMYRTTAIDNIILTPGKCESLCSINNPCLNGGSCSSTKYTVGFQCLCTNGFVGEFCETPTIETKFTCSFEPDKPCFLTQPSTNRINWIVQTEQGISTGTNAAFEGLHYGYLQSNTSHKYAAFVNNIPDLPTTNRCLEFHYHMSGLGVGSLKVKTKDLSGLVNTIWSRKGDQGDSWHRTMLYIPASEDFNIKIEGNLGPYKKRNIAIDNVKLTPGDCGWPCFEYKPCLNDGICIMSDFFNYKCQCVNGYQGDRCQTPSSTTSFTCSFEPGKPCFLSQSAEDDIDWTVIEGKTLTAYTGPTGASEGLFYSHIDATLSFHKHAAYIINGFELPETERCLKFDYHMYGSTMGALNVLTKDNTGFKMTVWSKHGSQGTSWHKASVPIPADKNIKIYIEGVVGENGKSDIAIDNVALDPEKCELGTDYTLCTEKVLCYNGGICSYDEDILQAMCICKNGYSGEHCEVPSVSTVFTCTFEPGEPCFLAQSKDDDNDWRIHTGNTKTLYTGPKNASEGLYYSYLEASASDKSSVYQSNVHNFPETERCLQFDYNMYGQDIGQLNIRIKLNNGTDVKLWSKRGNKGTDWHKTTISLPYHQLFGVYIEGILGSGTKGDLAIDNIILFPGKCNPCLNGGKVVYSDNYQNFVCQCINGYQGELCEDPSISTVFTCPFEPDSPCFLDQSENDDKDWILNRERTKSIYTGPVEASQGHWYIFLEATDSANKTAVLKSGIQYLPEAERCLEFDYYMYGKDMGHLNVKITDDTGSEYILWSKHGNKGQKWLRAVIPMPSVPGIQIYIEGIVGQGEASDIAIDNLVMFPGKCYPCLHGGKPVRSENWMTFTCICRSGYIGEYCEKPDLPTVFACTGKKLCFNGGRCNFDNKTSIATCICENGYVGENCETASIETVFTCSFEPDTPCFLTQSDDQKWKINVNRTPSPYTGPQNASEGLYYSYIDSRNSPNKRAMYRSPILLDTERCLCFDYHMYGKDMGRLKIKTKDYSKSESVLWRKSGPQGRHWNTAIIDVPSGQEISIIVEGITGYGSTSDIAIDNVVLFPGKCYPCINGGVVTWSKTWMDFECKCVNGYTGKVCETPTKSTVFTCSFEPETPCILVQSVHDSSDWIIKEKRTSTYYTGPDQAAEGTFYSYIEATNSLGNTAAYEINISKLPGIERCLEFAYHMYGKDMGTLLIKIIYNFGSETSAWSRTGNQLQDWKKAYVPIPYINVYKVYIEGRIGDGEKSDIAIDNIVLHPGSCGNKFENAEV